MTNVGDPVGAGLVASLARPGGNVTGLSTLGSELNTKRLEILKDAIPKLARVGLLRRGSAPSTRTPTERAQGWALALKLNWRRSRHNLTPKVSRAPLNRKQKQVNAIMTIAGSRFLRNESGSSSLLTNTSCQLFTFQRSLS